MPAKKPVPRAVLEERLRVAEEEKAEREVRAEKRSTIAIGVGSYFVVVAGVLASQVVSLKDDLSATFELLEMSQLLGGMLIAGAVFNRTEGQKEDLAGKAKKGNVGRSLLTAFYNGFFWMTMVGAWW